MKNERHAIMKLSRFYSDHFCFPNVHLFGWELDLAIVAADSKRLWEIEVKLSIDDWRADAKKNKWSHPRSIERREKNLSRFFYAVPSKLVNLTTGLSPKTTIPPFVPDTAGIIMLDPYMKVVRPATLNKNADPVSDKLFIELLKKTHYRFWYEQYHKSRSS